MSTTSYAVLDAPGHHGDIVTVWANFEIVEQARSFAKRGGCRILEGCGLAKGSKIGRGPLQSMVDRGDWRVVS